MRRADDRSAKKVTLRQNDRRILFLLTILPIYVSASDGTSYGFGVWEIVAIVAAILIFLLIFLLGTICAVRLYRRTGGAVTPRIDSNHVRMISWQKLKPLCIIGEGSFSIVIKAELYTLATKSVVAVKIFKNHDLDMMLNEYNLAQRARNTVLHYSNTLKVDGLVVEPLDSRWKDWLVEKKIGYMISSFGSAKDCAALVARFEGGGSLHTLLHNTSSPCILSLSERIRILKEIAVGLQQLHYCDNGYIVHGDLKPENILLNENKEVRLIDFGLSKFKESAGSKAVLPSLRVIGGHVGTFAYLAPELDLHVLENSRTTDMYSFGTVCWEVLSGKIPWSQFAGRKTMRAVFIKDEGGSLDLEQLPPNTPESVTRLIRECLSYNHREKKQQRPTALEAAAILSRALDALGGKRDIFLSYAWGKEVDRVLSSETPRKGSFPMFPSSPVSRKTRKSFGAVDSDKSIKQFTRQPLSLLIYKELRKLQFSVWMDVYDMGNDLRESMRNGIRNSRSMVVLLSPEYVKSSNCRYELETALSYAEEVKTQGGEFPIITCMVCDPMDIYYTNDMDPQDAHLFQSIQAKLQFTQRKYCYMQKAVEAGQKVSWGDNYLTVEHRELLTHDPRGFVLLREILHTYGIVGTDTGKSESLEPKADRVELVKNLIALEEEKEHAQQGGSLISITTSQNSSSIGSNVANDSPTEKRRPTRVVFPENDDDDDFREDSDEEEGEEEEEEEEEEDGGV